MSSTDFDTPPVRLILLAIISVVGLHVLTAVALVAVRPPAPSVKLPEVTPPIEIQLLAPPVEIEEPIEIKKVVTKEVQKAAPEPLKEVKLQPKAEPKPQVVEKSKPIEKSKPVESLPVKTSKPVQKQKAADNEVKDNKVEPIKSNTPDMVQKNTTVIESAINEEPVVTRQMVQKTPIKKTTDSQVLIEQQRQIVAAQAERATQAERAEQEARDKAERDAKAAHAVTLAAQNAQKLAAEEAARQAQAAKEQAVKDAAEQAARDKVEQQKAAEQKAAQEKAAASNTPVNFTASNANWASIPNFSFPSRAERGARSGDVFSVVLVLRVNKQGGIDNVTITQSSGNAILDREAQRQVRSGKFKPFNKDGVPVVGNVTLPISYRVP